MSRAARPPLDDDDSFALYEARNLVQAALDDFTDPRAELREARELLNDVLERHGHAPYPPEVDGK